MNRKLRATLGALSASLLLAGSALAAPDAADDALFGPPPPPVAVPAPPVVAAPVAPAPTAAAPLVAPRLPAAAGSARPGSTPWLRQAPQAAAQKLETKAPMSPVRIGSMLLLVGLLGGGAYYARKRRQGSPAPVVTEKLRVLGSTRVGPKAHAVVAEVGGKRLLLGVTDQSVNTLAWLDSEPVDEDRSELRPSRPAPIRRETEEAAQGPSGFLRVLRNAVGSRDVRGVAADEIAKHTRDEVTLSRRSGGKVEPDELEGQVRGLSRRRRDPS